MPQKQKLSVEEKVKIILSYLNGEISRAEAARKGGVFESVIAEWTRNYEVDGVEAFLPQKNRTYSTELKRQAVEDYLSGGGSLSDICKKYHIRGLVQLRRWVKVYNAHGDVDSVKYSGGGSYMTQGRDTTQEERIQIAKDCIASGRNYGEIALKYNVSYQQARTWTLRFAELGEAGVEDRRGKRTVQQTPRTVEEELRIKVARLEHKLYMAEMERDLLKKLDEIERRDAFHK